MKSFVKLTLLGVVTLCLASCGSNGKVMVKKPVDAIRPVASVKIERLEPYVPVQSAQERAFEEELARSFFTVEADENQAQSQFQEMNAEEKNASLPKPVYTEGNDIKVQYRFVQMEEGSQMTRLLTGGIGNYGEGNVTIEVSLVDKNNASVGKFHTEGKVSTGLTGGTLDNAVQKAAKEAASYVKLHFPPKLTSAQVPKSAQQSAMRGYERTPAEMGQEMNNMMPEKMRDDMPQKQQMDETMDMMN